MPRTRLDLVVSALDLLGVTQVGQDPSAEDSEKVDQEIDGKLAELARRQVFYVQDVDCIDDEVFLPLAKLIANAVGPKFGQAYSPDTDDREEMRLRLVDRSPMVYDTLRVCPF